MIFTATKAKVANRGVPPDSFLAELVTFGRTAPDSIFAPNDVADDIYARIKPQLGPQSGPWTDIVNRKAAILEALRVLSGFESSWTWTMGRDMSAGPENAYEMEAGTWQESENSEGFGQDLIDCIERYVPGASHDPYQFQSAMKTNHALAIEYTARLLRHTVRANGPVLRNEINPYLSRAAAAEFQSLIIPTFS